LRRQKPAHQRAAEGRAGAGAGAAGAASSRGGRGAPDASRRRGGGGDAVSTGTNGKRATRAQVLDEVRGAQKFPLGPHETPAGDALASLVAMHQVLVAAGKDSIMFMDADEFPLPYEYRFFSLDGLVSVPPADIEERTIVFLDCGNIDRNPADALK